MSIRKHIDLVEGFEDMDDGGPFDHSSYDREKKIEALLKQAIAKVGLELAEVSYNVAYTSEDHEAFIKVYEGASLAQLQALSVFGEVSVRADPGHILLIEIKVHDGFDADASIV